MLAKKATKIIYKAIVMRNIQVPFALNVLAKPTLLVQVMSV